MNDRTLALPLNLFRKGQWASAPLPPPAHSAIDSPLLEFERCGPAPPGTASPVTKAPANIEIRTPIGSVPYAITHPGLYYLTADLADDSSGATGIMVCSSDVTLDLNGFTLQGAPNSGSGIYVTGSYSNLVVCNGTIRGWGGSGIDSFSLGYPRNMLFEHLTVSENGANGILTEAGSVVRDCLALSNGMHGIASVGGEIVGCICRGNQEFGVAAAYCTVVQCRIEYNLSGGFQSLGLEGQAVIADCALKNNSGFGIAVKGPGCLITRNSCILNSNGGIYLESDHNRIEKNHVLTPKGVPGIRTASSDYTHNAIVNNTVSDNVTENINHCNSTSQLGIRPTAYC
jgi:hypothetical protein